MKRRPNILIMMRIIEILIREPLGPTRIAQASNLNYQKCVEFLSLLEERKLIKKERMDEHDVYSVTSDAIILYGEWSRIWERLNLH